MLLAGRSKIHGFTLLEALIGFLILSIGMLGIASLQAVSLKAGQSSVYGSIAMMKVEDLFENMRANPGSRDFPNVLASYVGAGAANNCTANLCSQTNLALDDKFLWLQDLNASFPSGAASAVTLTPAVAPSKMATVNVVINWSERDKISTGSVTKSINVTTNICTEMPC